MLLLIFYTHTSPEMQELSKDRGWGGVPAPLRDVLAQTRVEACLLLKLELTHEPGLLEDGGVSQLVGARQKTPLGKAHFLVSL